MIYLILIITIIFSYRIFENIFNKLGNDQLWTNRGYYCWGLVLLVIYFIVRPNDYVFKTPINNKIGIKFILFFLTSTFFICITNLNVYYPKKINKLKCFHYGVIQPIFEEIAFRGLILCMTINLLAIDESIIILLNGIIFMAFHLNYWSFKKENIKLFLNFLALGILFNYITLITHSIIYSIVCHIIMNGGITVYRNWNKMEKN